MMTDVMEMELTKTQDERPIRVLVRLLRKGINLLDTLQISGNAPRVFWQNGQLTTAYAGWGVTASITASGSTRYADVRREVERLLACTDVEGTPQDAAPRFFGGFAFRDDFTPNGVWRQFPNTFFSLPRVMITDTDGQQWLTLTSRDENEDLASVAAGITEQLYNLQPVSTVQHAQVTDTHYPLSLDGWREQVNEGVSRIHNGELEKVVLSRTSEIQFDRPIALEPVLARLSQRYPATYRFLIEPEYGHAFVGATPELLIEVSGGHVRTAAVAGSVPRGKTEREDAEYAAELFTSQKERHEHALVANALCDLLEPLTAHLTYPDEPQILKLGNIQHLYTPFSGALKGHLDVLHAVEKLHPTPALGGCPQEAAVAAINEIEQFDRGWFASPLGWIDGCGNGMLAVAIRSAVINESTARLYAGCGIVAQSNPDSEWKETAIKFRPMLDALGAEVAL